MLLKVSMPPDLLAADKSKGSRKTLSPDESISLTSQSLLHTHSNCMTCTLIASEQVSLFAWCVQHDCEYSRYSTEAVVIKITRCCLVVW